MVKNNILLTVLLASFTAPIFASSLIPKECPFGEQGKFVAALALVDYTSSRFTCLHRAFDFYSNANTTNTSSESTVLLAQAKKLSTDQEDLTSAVITDASQIKEVRDKLAEMSKPTTDSSDTRTFLQKILGTNISVDLNTVGINGGVSVNLVSALAKAAATYAMIEGSKAVVAKVFAPKKS